MAEPKMYDAPNLNLQDLAQAMLAWFRGQSFEAQIFHTPDGATIVQARKAGGWRVLVGMAAALNVTMRYQPGQLIVEMGAAQWADKAVVGAAGALVFLPLLIPAAFGAWQQQQLPSQVDRFIEQYLLLSAQISKAQAAPAAPTEPFAAEPAPAAAQAQPEAHCPVCGKVVRAGAQFCDACGARLKQVCSKCGMELRPGARFCDACGQAVEA